MQKFVIYLLKTVKNEWMSVWMNERKNEGMKELLNGWMNEWIIFNKLLNDE